MWPKTTNRLWRCRNPNFLSHALHGGEGAVCFGVGIEKEDFEGPGFAGLDGAGVGGDGGIAGDFPICVVPMLEQDVRREDVRKWAYFCQISDSTTSYGSYSGAVPNE